MARDTPAPHIDPNSAEFTRLLREARARRAPVPLEDRLYPNDRPGTQYTTSGD